MQCKLNAAVTHLVASGTQLLQGQHRQQEVDIICEGVCTTNTAWSVLGLHQLPNMSLNRLCISAQKQVNSLHYV